MVGVIFTLIMAGIVGWLADLIVPGRLPFGWIGAIVAGLIGSGLGARFLGNIGPVIAGIPFISALIGTVVVAFIVNLAMKLGAGQRTA
ncbi:MAG: GlsB/YeaQ/YmgE family stress response membrane protein [Chloroflexi bacterium]|nr:GlsB/YeaQ/YmgE family stress response membrane protein [Chloroflexota bacterium]